MKAALVTVALALAAAGCSGKREAASGRLVILQFENLTGNPALDWMSRGAARQIGAQLKGSFVADSPQAGGDRARAIAAGAQRILHGYVSQTGGNLRLRADIEEPASRKFPQWVESSGPVSQGLLPLADAVARQLDPAAAGGGAKTEAALAAYTGALNAPDGAAAADSLSRAISADRDFGSAYLALVELSLARKDRETAERTLAQARARGNAIQTVDRARLDVAAAQVSGDRDAMSKALAALSNLVPGDAGLLHNLADAALAAKRYPAAIEYYRKALAAQPGDAALLNSLGYAQAYAGDVEGAEKTLGEYQRVRPAEANPLDSTGEVNFYSGRFAEAEKFYRQAYAKDATFQNGVDLLKAATAHLMTGDVNGAETAFAEYEAARRTAQDPLIDFTRAQWDYLRGKRADAIRGMQKFGATARAGEAVALADCVLTVWQLEAGHRDEARKRTACRFLTEPEGAAFPSPLAKVYALLLARNFQAALPLLRQLEASAPPSPMSTIPALLAWALVETGHVDDAEKYLQASPLPSAPTPDPFQSLIYPRIFYLRAKVAEKKGQKAVAEQNSHIFAALTEPQPK